MALYSIIQYISVTLLYSVRKGSSKRCSWEIVSCISYSVPLSLLFLRSSAILETFSSSSLILPSSSLLFLPVSNNITGNNFVLSSGSFSLIFFIFLLHPIVSFCSESERSMERIGFLPSPIGSHFGTFADVCDDADPHLFRLSDLYLLLGQRAVLVHSMDTNYRVSTIKHC